MKKDIDFRRLTNSSKKSINFVS